MSVSGNYMTFLCSPAIFICSAISHDLMFEFSFVYFMFHCFYITSLYNIVVQSVKNSLFYHILAI